MRKTNVWVETLILALLGLSQIQCSQDDVTFKAVPPNSTVLNTEVKTLAYNGRFHAQALLVLDNSGSMQTALANYINSRLQSFMANMAATPGLTFQIGITNTNNSARNGQLFTSNNGTKIITQASPSNIFSEIFSRFITSQGEVYADLERGLGAAAAAVQREQSVLFSSVASNVTLNRTVVIISDADDTDTTPVSNYAQVFKSIPGLTLQPIIAIPARGGCPDPAYANRNLHESLGTRYVEAVSLVGGDVSSICAPDFAASLDGVFDLIQNVCVTLDRPVTSPSQISFWINDVRSNGFIINGSGRSICTSLPTGASTLKVEARHED